MIKLNLRYGCYYLLFVLSFVNVFVVCFVCVCVCVSLSLSLPLSLSLSLSPHLSLSLSLKKGKTRAASPRLVLFLNYTPFWVSFSRLIKLKLYRLCISFWYEHSTVILFLFYTGHKQLKKAYAADPIT